jgi:hypothetical protein
VIPRSGVAISPTAEERLIFLGYYIRHLKRTSRPIPGQFVAARVLSMAEIKRREEEDKTLAKDATALSTIDDLKKIREAFENIEDYLSKVRGTTGVPLRHVIRNDDEVPDDPDNMYPSVLDKMIDRYPHDGEDFAADNNQVWSVIRACTHGVLPGAGFLLKLVLETVVQLGWPSVLITLGRLTNRRS